jgi:hypothetical protein
MAWMASMGKLNIHEETSWHRGSRPANKLKIIHIEDPFDLGKEPSEQLAVSGYCTVVEMT